MVSSAPSRVWAESITTGVGRRAITVFRVSSPSICGISKSMVTASGLSRYMRLSPKTPFIAVGRLIGELAFKATEVFAALGTNIKKALTGDFDFVKIEALNLAEAWGSAFDDASDTLSRLEIERRKALAAVVEEKMDDDKKEIKQVVDPIYANARGAAWIGAVGLAELTFGDVSQLIQFKQTYTPDQKQRGLYDERFEVFTRIYRQMKGVYRRLNR